MASRGVDAATVTLMWDANPDPGVQGYIVYMGTASGVYTSTVDVGNTTSYVVPGGIPGQAYYFAVAAYNAAGIGPKSTEITAFSNANPTLFNPGNQIGTVGSAVSLRLQGNDPYGEPISYSASNLPPGLSLAPATGVISGTPTQVGTYAVTVSASDGVLSASQTFSWTIHPSTAAAVTPIAPIGPIDSALQSFVWSAAPNATQYTLRIEDSTGIVFQQTYAATQLGCAAGTAPCKTPTIAVPSGTAQWTVLASTAVGDGPWSSPASMSFVTDATAPQVTITSPGGTVTLPSSGIVRLTGVAADNVGVTQVTWMSSSGGTGIATGTTSWSADVKVQRGWQAVVVMARDAAGNTGYKVHVFTVQ